jgi:methylated-DNA-[protein]-cysteine S-methyltransferase
VLDPSASIGVRDLDDILIWPNDRSPASRPESHRGPEGARATPFAGSNKLDPCRQVGQIATMATTCFDTSFGPCAIAWEVGVITGFSLPPTRCGNQPTPPWISDIISRVQRHLTGEMQDFADLPFSWAIVSAFQRKVYQAALSVKPGQTASYGQLAAASGHPSLSREVGQALAQNPWPLLIPCHRFIGADGRMTGFSSPGGIKTKLRLLALEGAQLFAE